MSKYVARVVSESIFRETLSFVQKTFDGVKKLFNEEA